MPEETDEPVPFMVLLDGETLLTGEANADCLTEPEKKTEADRIRAQQEALIA